MITRYNVNFEDRMIEASEEGRFVKYKDHQQTEMLVDIKVEEILSDRLKAEREDLRLKSEQAGELQKVNDRLEAELAALKESSEKIIAYQGKLVESARERLNLLGHAPNCDSRYGTVSPEGSRRMGECHCGLDAWMHESGVYHG